MSQEAKKTVVITGGTRGIGQGIAVELASPNHFIIVVGRSNGDETVAKVEAAGGEAIFQPLDIGEESAVQDFFSHVQEKFGGCDILVNNAGIAKDFLFMRSKLEDWQSLIQINLIGTLLCSRAASQQMIKKRWGRIVNVASILGLGGNAGQTLYCATKHAIVGFTRSLAKEIAKRNVTVNAVCPGFIETDMTRDIPEPVREAYLKDIPVGRMGSPSDVAACCRFLASEQASYVTGQTLVVDGGLTA